jgi:hypothetical protein
MNDAQNKYLDWYLVTPKGELLVSRAAEEFWSRTEPRSKSLVLVSGLKSSAITFNREIWKKDSDEK